MTSTKFGSLVLLFMGSSRDDVTSVMFGPAPASNGVGWDGIVTTIAVQDTDDAQEIETHMSGAVSNAVVLVRNAASEEEAIGGAVTAFLRQSATEGQHIRWIPSLGVEPASTHEEEAPS